MFKDLMLLNEEQLKVASKEQIVAIFNKLNTTSQALEKELVNLRVTSETKQNESNKLVAEIQAEYGVTSIVELENLRAEKIHTLAQLGAELEILINNSGVKDE